MIVSTMRSTLLWILLGLPQAANADVADLLLENGFVEVDALTLSSWNSRVDRVFSVSLEPQCLQLDVGAEAGAADVRLQEGSFLYEGTDNGEWGGKLTVTEPDGTRRVLLEENVRALLHTQRGMLVFTGLAHLGTSRGAIHRVLEPDSRPQVERVTLLPDAPAIVVEDPRQGASPRTVILGFSSVMVLSEFGGDDHLEVLLIDQPWASLYPSSASMTQDQLVFGMRGGIAVVPVASYLGTRSTPRYFTTTETTRAPSGDPRDGDFSDRLPVCLGSE